MSLIATTLLTFASIALSQDQPNILWLWFDDLGFADTGYNGGVYQTPLLDQWADDYAIKLNFHYSEQVCSASRSALLTGRYAWRSGLNTVTTQLSNMHYDRDLTLYPEILEGKGYKGYIAGKWHVGYKYNNLLPHKRGFMNGTYGHTGTQYYNRGFQRSFEKYDEELPCIYNVTGTEHEDLSNALIRQCDLRDKNFRPRERLPTHDTWTIDEGEEVAVHIGSTAYGEDLFTDGIKDFIRLQNDSVAPFYIQYNLFTPHSNLVEPPNSTEADGAIPYDTYCEDEGLLANKKLFCRQMLYAQYRIQEIFDLLEETGLWLNTIVVVTSDNGAIAFSDNGVAYGQNLPLRGMKNGILEGGLRTPMFLYGGWIRKRVKQRWGLSETCEYNGLVHISDWYQILGDMAEVWGKKYKKKDYIDDDHIDLEIWDDIQCECNPDCNATTEYEERDELLAMRVCGNINGTWPNDKYYYQTFIRKGEWKLVINTSFSATDSCPPDQNSTGFTDTNIYLGPGNDSFYPVPDQMFFDDVYSIQFDKDYDRAALLYQSQCLEDLDQTDTLKYPDPNNSLWRPSEFALYHVATDKIEACNVILLYPEIADELFAEIQNRSMEYNGAPENDPDKPQYASPGALWAQINTWDCDYETTFLVPWNGNNEDKCGDDVTYDLEGRACNVIYKKLNQLVTKCDNQRRRRLADEGQVTTEVSGQWMYDMMWTALKVATCSAFISGWIVYEFGDRFVAKTES